MEQDIKECRGCSYRWIETNSDGRNYACSTKCLNEVNENERKNRMREV